MQVTLVLDDGPTGVAAGVGFRLERAAFDEVFEADATADFGEARLWSETTRFDLRMSEVPSPRPGDRLVLDGETFVVQGEPVRDRERLVWTLDVRPA